MVNAFSYLESSFLTAQVKGNEDPGYEGVVNDFQPNGPPVLEAVPARRGHVT